MTPYLQNFLEMNMGKDKAEKSKVRLGVQDVKLATSISEGTGLKCDNSELALELLRYVRAPIRSGGRSAEPTHL
jgi:hypothetical protein